MSTITTLNDAISANSFRTQTNTNFANLNSTKKEDSMTTNKLLGRSTAGTGAIEEITLGTGLSYTGTTLNVSAGAGDMILASTQTVSGLKTFLTGIFALRNVANTFSGFFTNTNTADRTYTLQDSSDTLIGRATTDTLTNKRITKRVSIISSSATPTSNTDNADIIQINSLNTNITNMSTNLTGSPQSGDMKLWSLTDDGTARTITWGASFEASTIALPTTTVISTRLDTLFIYNSITSKWRCVGVA